MEFAINAATETLTTIDIVWYFATLVTTALLGILVWQGSRMVGKLDAIEKISNKQAVAMAKTNQKVTDHIGNTGVHCNFPVCGRRIEDAT